MFSAWCAARIPADRRASLQVGYLIHGNDVTILERRPPAFPELGAAWSSAKVAQLRYGDPEPGLWSLYAPDGEKWRRYESADPVDYPQPLLTEVDLDPTDAFWPER